MMKSHQVVNETTGALTRRLKLALLAAAAPVVGIALSGAAYAQDAPATEAADGSAGEIIVTARKREESAIKVPVIQTILTQEEIDTKAIVDVKDIAAFSPGVVVGDSVLAVGTQVSLRGIGTNTLDPGVDQSIAMVIDGFAFTQGLPFQSGTFDVAQIEVLKGPQSLFFGKSSPAGVINIRTIDPGDYFQVMARASYEFEARTPRIEAAVGGPITDTLGVRIAGQYHRSDGFFYNNEVPLTGTGALRGESRVGGNEGFHVRGTFLWKPAPSFSARLKVNYVEDFDEYPGQFQLVGCPEGTAPVAGFLRTISLTDNCTLDRNFNAINLDPAAFPGGLNSHGGLPFSDKRQLYGTLEMNLDLGAHNTLTSVTGYYNLDFETYFNTFNASANGPNFGSSAFYQREEVTQELRLNSNYPGPLNYTAGLFYQHAQVDYLQTTARNKAINPAGTNVVSAQSSPLTIDSWSAFGQLRYRPSEQWEISAGGRYTSETRSDIPVNALTGVPFVTANPNRNSKTFSPEATISYFPNDDLTIFASYKKGYKSGSYSLSRLPPAAVPGTLPDNSFGDEKAEGGEIGIKARLADRQLNVNLAGYYYRFSGLQFSLSSAVGAALPTTRVVNAGSAEVYGIDLDAQYRPAWAEGLSVNLGMNWNRAKFLDLQGVPCYGGQTAALGCNQVFALSANQVTPPTGAISGTTTAGLTGFGFYTAQANLAGTPLPRAPEWTVNFGLAYDLKMASGWGLKLTHDLHFQSDQWLSVGTRSELRQGSYVKADFGAYLTDPNERWELAFITKNVFNKITSGTCALSNYANGGLLRGTQQITGGGISGAEGVDEVACIPERGRSLMLRLTYKYDGDRRAAPMPPAPPLPPEPAYAPPSAPPPPPPPPPSPPGERG